MRSETVPPSVPGVLTPDDVVATARSIAAQQEASGAIPWFSPVGGVPGHVDAWNHVEAAMALTVAGFGAEARRA
ncbi:prenyltransferase, partial [Micromonospora aurantiaca]|nr:prenyltransferase [Micromonospora aurantiaca]